MTLTQSKLEYDIDFQMENIIYFDHNILYPIYIHIKSSIWKTDLSIFSLSLFHDYNRNGDWVTRIKIKKIHVLLVLTMKFLKIYFMNHERKF